MSSPDQPNPGLVLAIRDNAGIRMSLLWTADTNTVTVLDVDAGAMRVRHQRLAVD